MQAFVQHLSKYAAYHRDKRNIATHFVAAELAFELGLRKDVQSAVEARVGPPLIRRANVA